MLFKKMWRDLLQNKTQFISIFLMALLSMFIYVGLDAESSGALIAANNYYESLNLADLWIMGSGFSDDDVKLLSKVKGVQSVEREIYVTGTVNMEENPYMYAEFLTTNEISKMSLFEGEKYREGAEGIWLEKLFCEKNNIKVGDNFSFKVMGANVDTIVKGIVDSPEYVYYVSEEDVMYPNYAKCCLGFLSYNSFPINPSTYNRIRIKAKEGTDVSALKKRVEDTLNREDIAVTDRNQNLSYATFDSEIKQHKVFGIMFAVVFVLIALLGIITTMARVTANQRTQIGTLKALGFSKRAITWHYVSYGFVISLVGSLCGALLGVLTLPPWILGMFEGAYILPGLKGHVSTESLLVLAASVLVSTLVSYLSCRKELIEPPAVTLRPKAAKKIKTSFFEKSFIWRMLNFSTQWNIRDVSRNKIRSLMGIIGVLGCAMLLLTGFGCLDSTNGMIDTMYGQLMTANNKVVFSSDAGYDFAYDFSKKYKGQMIEEVSVEFVSTNQKKNGSATIIDKGNYVNFQDKNHNNIKLTKTGIAMSYKMAQNLNVKQGDFVSWHIVGDDKWQKTRIAQIYRDPSVQGIAMKRDVFESLEYDFIPTGVLTNKSVDKSLTDEEEISTILNITDMKATFSKTMEMMYSMIFIMIFAATLLGFIVLYNLGVLSFVEKTREVATLKVLGFSSSKIRGILQKQNIWLTCIGIVFGIFAGIFVLVAMCSAVSESLDLFPVVSIPTYIYTVIGTFLVSIAVNFMFSGKVKTIDMVDALKGVE